MLEIISISCSLILSISITTTPRGKKATPVILDDSETCN